MHDDTQTKAPDELARAFHLPRGRPRSPSEILADLKSNRPEADREFSLTAALLDSPTAFLAESSAGPEPSSAPSPAAPPAGEDDGAKALPFEKLSLLPQVGDPYQAHARPVSHFLPMLVLIARDGAISVLSYGDLRAIDSLPPKRPGHGPGLLLRFLGVRDVELEGVQNLDHLVGYLYLHRIAWIRELPLGQMVRDDNAVVITRMTQTPAPVLPSPA